MKIYANEAAFSRDLNKHFTSLGYFVQRIESHETGRGIPDLYVGVHTGEQYWIELKRIKGTLTRDISTILVPWRPGQQGWMYRHYNITRVPCFTFIAFNNCIVAISHAYMYRGNRVPVSAFVQLWESVHAIRL